MVVGAFARRGLLALAAVSLVASCKPRREGSQVKNDYQPRIAADGDWSVMKTDMQEDFDNYVASKQRAWDWWRHSPLGFGGVPLVLLRAMVETMPEVWGTDSPLAVRLGGPWNQGQTADDGTSFADLGFSNRPEDYDANGLLKPERERRFLPWGLEVVKDTTVPADRQTHNVFFACGGCHSGRVVIDDNGTKKIKHLFGAPSTEIDAQAYSGLILLAAKALTTRPVDQPLDPAALDPGKVRQLVIYMERKLADVREPTWPFPSGGPVTARQANAEVRAVIAGIRAAGAPNATQEVKEASAIGAFMGTAKKTELIYMTIGGGFAYRQNSPHPIGPRPGRMDAFGISTGLVALHALRPDFGMFKGTSVGGRQITQPLPDDHPFFQGLDPALTGDAKYAAARDRIFDPRNAAATLGRWVPLDPGPSDIKALWMSKSHAHANWDGNQGAMARVLASGVSSVGDPSKVDVPVHEPMNDFINDMPPLPYPFDVDMAKAAAGEAIFNTNCATCHYANNDEIYGADTVATEMFRATHVSPTARLGLIELIREACEIANVRSQGQQQWCMPPGGPRQTAMAARAAADEDLFRFPRNYETTRPASAPPGAPPGYSANWPLGMRKPNDPDAGYKADEFHGIWAQAPYLHNGSVPTLWHLLRPNQRPATFVRGNITYDQEKVGFNSTAPAASDYPAGEASHYFTFNTALRGNGNQGHDYGATLSDDDVAKLLEYMKTL